MADPRTARRAIFTADTIEGLRDQLNQWAADMAEQFETETIIVKGVQFVPVRGPYTKAAAPKGLMFLRKLEYDESSTSQQMHIVLPHSALDVVLQIIGSGTATEDADGESQAGGLH